MRKLAVLFLAGALLAVTGGASVARAKDFAILQCFLFGGDDPGVDPIVLAVSHAETSFPTPTPECDQLASCSGCAAAISQSGDHLKLVNLNQGEGNVPDEINRLVFAEGALSSVPRAAEDEDFAMLFCFASGTAFLVTHTVDTSFPVPAECMDELSCSDCVDAITENGLELVGVNNVDGIVIKMVFAGDDDDNGDDDDD